MRIVEAALLAHTFGVDMPEALPEPLRAGHVLAGRYRLEELAGAGGMAVVWRAWDERLERTVAIKVTSEALASDPDYAVRFAREAQIAAQISHPNLVEIFDFSAGSSQAYLVMQYVEGGTLQERLADAQLSGPDLLALTRDLLAALSAVHRRGVLHRDVKPSNVLLGPDGRARLTDFGVARLEDTTHLTQTGHLVGTLRFLAPELVSGAEPSPQSDLYSLGILLREAGSDRVRELRPLIDALADNDPDRRPTSAEAALAELPEATPVSSPALRETRPDATVAMDGATEPMVVNPPSETTIAGDSQLASSGLDSPTLRLSSAPPRRARRPRHTAALLALTVGLLAVGAVVVVLLAAGGGGQPTARYSVAPKATLAQRFNALDREIRSAPGH